jgi:radical SAM superfamily enzyme YgiQ (UPF0313 family)
MNVLLILPADLMYRCGGFFRRSLSYAPLTLTTLAALIPAELSAQLTLIDEGIQRIDYERLAADVVGLTCVASSSPRAAELATYWRRRGAYVVIGGAHATLAPQEMVVYADAVVVGPAERIWPALLRQYARGVPARGIIRDDDPLPLPTVRPRRELLPRRGYLRIPTVLAARGCAHDCAFCSIHHLWGHDCCCRPVQEVVEEIAQLGARRVLFLDPSQTCDREYAARLYEALLPLEISWAGLATIDLAFDRELLDLAVRSGCRGILTGFESLSQEAVDRCHKRTNDVGRYVEAVKGLHARGVGILGCFVVGFDGDTERTFGELLEFVDRSHVDLPRFAILTPFPGTELYADLRRDGRLLTENRLYYDTEHVVFAPARMSPQELELGFIRLWQRSYTHSRMTRRVAGAPRGLKLLGLAANSGFRHYTGRLDQRLRAGRRS